MTKKQRNHHTARLVEATVPHQSTRDGCFPPEHPHWRVVVIEDSPDYPRLLVCDADDQCYEQRGPRAEVLQAFELLTSTGPLSWEDIRDVVYSLPGELSKPRRLTHREQREQKRSQK